MTVWIARGRPGERPHFSQNKSIAQRNLAADEVLFEVDALPTGDCIIAADGKSLTTIEASTEQLWHEVRAKRNRLLDHWRWTVAPDSPLSKDCCAAFLEYLKALNRITIDYADSKAVVWPETPPLSY